MFATLIPEMVSVAVVALVYVAPVGVPLDTFTQVLPLKYCHTGFCVPVPPVRLEVTSVDPPVHIVLFVNVGVERFGAATTEKETSSKQEPSALSKVGGKAHDLLVGSV